MPPVRRLAWRRGGRGGRRRRHGQQRRVRPRRVEDAARRAAARHAQSLRQGRPHPAGSRGRRRHGRRRPRHQRRRRRGERPDRSSTTRRSASTPTSWSSARSCGSRATASGSPSRWRRRGSCAAIAVWSCGSPRKTRRARARTAFLFVGNNEYETDGLDLGARARLDGGQLVAYFAPRVHARDLPKLLALALAGRAKEHTRSSRSPPRSCTSTRPDVAGCASPSMAR